MSSTTTSDPAPEGLRQRNKQKRHNQIIAAGRILFFERGYAKTTLEAVAEAAQVGVATVYNHFGTKARLRHAILVEDFDALHRQADRFVEDAGQDVLTDICALIDIYCQLENNWQQKDLLMAVLGPGLAEDADLDALAEDAEAKVKAQLTSLLFLHQRAGSLQSEVNIEDAAKLIFLIFNQHFIEYVAQDGCDMAAMQREMARLISFVVTSIIRR